MLNYKVYYGEICIGQLFINEKGEYKYITDRDAIERVEKEVELLYDVKVDKDYGEPIDFFKVRIDTVNGISGNIASRVIYPNSKYILELVQKNQEDIE